MSLYLSPTTAAPRLAAFALLAVLLAGKRCFALDFAAALALAEREAPTLAAGTAEIEAARQAAIPAGELPDPQLALGIDNLPIQGAESFSLSRDFMTMQRVGVTQSFPNLAKLDARIAVAEGRVALAEVQTRLARLQVLQETASAWIARYTAERQLARLAELETENRRLIQAVNARFAGGTGLAADVVAPRQEAALLASRRDELDSRRLQAIAQLKRWIGDAASQPLSGELPVWEINADTLSHGLHRHPELDVLARKGRVLDAEAAEARAEKIPDWALQLAYQKRGAAYGDMVSLQVSIDLPILPESRQQPKLQAKLAERNAVDAEHQAALREHAAMLESALAEYQRLGKAVQRQQETLVPLAAEKAELTLAAWRGGKAELPALLAARQERMDAELQAIALEGERRQLAARLHYTYSQQTLDMPNAEQQP